MNIFESIQNLFLEEMSAITIPSLLTAVVLSFLLGLFVVLIYKVTYSGAMFSRSFAMCLVLLAMVTSVVILTISSNVVLSLGMVGALSIVRFRTAVKDPMDTIFMFWAIVVGIITGAGFVPVAIIATLLVGALFVLLNLSGVKFAARNYLVVVRYDERANGEVYKTLESLGRFKVKARNLSDSGVELVAEMKLDEQQMRKSARLRAIEGVRELNILSYTGSTML